MRLENGVRAWENIRARYVMELMENVEKYLAELDDARWQFPKKKYENCFVEDYARDMDKTHDLDQELASWYQSLIGMPM